MHLASLQTHTFLKTLPLNNIFFAGESISMISLLSRHFQLENPREKFQYISRPFLHSSHHFYISNLKISNFLVCSFPFSFSFFFFPFFVCSTSFFFPSSPVKKGKENVEKKVFSGSCPSPFSSPTVVFSSEDAWTVQTYT